MELKIKPAQKNTSPLGGLLIKSPHVAAWLKEIQLLKLSLDAVEIFAVPGILANSTWGCFIIPSGKFFYADAGMHERCQQVHANVFIPENAVLSPSVSPEEMSRLFPEGIHVFHPEFGVAQAEPFSFEGHVAAPVQKSYYVTRPEPPAFVPRKIRSFQIQQQSPEDVMKDMEENIFPKREQMKDKPLNILEKLKLGLYRMIYSKTVKGGEAATEKTGFWKKIESFISSVAGKNSKWAERMQEDFEGLEERNKKEVDKLLELLKKNPAEALKYAIPLDEGGTNRGGDAASFSLSMRWSSRSLFGGGGWGSGGGSGGGTVNLGNHYWELQKQYNATAEELIRQGDYQKAAFVYMKLLKNDFKAAETLEKGAYYREAASVYLKYCKNQKKAAECYEAGNMINDAIDIYKEMNEDEKVGDLYVSINKREDANRHYKKVADNYEGKDQYVKASLIYKNKMHDKAACAGILLSGWQHNKDAFNCLNNYFSNMDDLKMLGTEINRIHAKEVTPSNAATFLQVIRHEYQKENELSGGIRDIAYEIVAEQIAGNPQIVSELKHFNPKDKQLSKDTMNYINTNRK